MQNIANRLMKRFQSWRRNSERPSPRIKAASEKRFIRINVAKTGHKPLIQQHALDPPLARLQKLFELGGRQREGLPAELMNPLRDRFRAGPKINTAETPDVAEK